MPDDAELAGLTWPDVAARAARTTLAVPLGSTEQHGPHLPLSTDTDLALVLARRLAAARPGVLVAPAVSYGSSGEHAAFPGTLSIGADALEVLLVELIRSADAFAGVVLVSTHGGNAVPLSRAARRLAGEGRRVLAWSPPPGDPTDTHAGHAETSALLAVRPQAVRIQCSEPGVSRPIRELMPLLQRDGVAAVSASGVLGDPSGASARAGRELLDGWAAALVEAVDQWP